MGREIKFRAWDKEKKYMVEHTYLACYVLKEILEYPNFELMQFTGLLDSKRTEEYPEGQEVYEGDIVKAFRHNEDEHVNEIIRRGGVLWFGNWNWVEFQNIFRSIKVIGNKHDNPELSEAI